MRAVSLNPLSLLLFAHDNLYWNAGKGEWPHCSSYLTLVVIIFSKLFAQFGIVLLVTNYVLPLQDLTIKICIRK